MISSEILLVEILEENEKAKETIRENEVLINSLLEQLESLQNN